MSRQTGKEWMCIGCGHVLGHMAGGELIPDGVEGKNCRTSGPNLVVTCPECSFVKTFYTSDAVVRAMYQLIHAVSGAASKSMISEIGKSMRDQQK